MPLVVRHGYRFATRAALLLMAAPCLSASLAAQAPLLGPWQSRAENVLPRIENTGQPFPGAFYTLRPREIIMVQRGSRALLEVGALLAGELRRKTGTIARVVVDDSGRTPPPFIYLDTTNITGPDPEEYQVRAGKAGIMLSGTSSTGLIWAMRTMLSLLERTPDDAGTSWRMPSVDVMDRPRYAWRGSMLDVGRHFLPVRDIERHIDLLSRYKLNVLHWHLTDDQGWRLEIKRYPQLTSVGAWRTEADGTRSGGFYTQAQVRHLVDYARRRGVTIVPEIEMPGHSSAALAAYPNLGCTNARIRVPTTWGVFADIYCVGKPEVFTFLKGVLDEVMALFPSPVIHIGGDEVPKDRWKACASCQALMKREGLANEEALQSWFMQQIAAHVATRGRRVMGWDEVMDGPYVPGGMVQSWRDSSFTRIAALREFDVIASPSDFTYLNRSASELRAVDVYQFTPLPASLDSIHARRVRGGEVPLWSEHIVSGANLELMALPRLLAFSDAMWNRSTRDFGEFEPRLRWEESLLRADGYAVGPRDDALTNITVAFDSTSMRPLLRTRTFANALVVRGTTDGSAPRASSPPFAKLTSLSSVPLIRVQPFWGTSRVGEERRIALVRHVAIGARVHSEPAVDARYPGTGAFSLVDGMQGSDNHGDGLWQGWWKPSVTITVELPREVPVTQLRARFLQNSRSWILLPRTVDFAWSADGITWSPNVRTTHAVPTTADGAIIHAFAARVPARQRVRFVRVTAQGGGPLPVGHPGAGQPAWLFADEVMVVGAAAAH